MNYLYSFIINLPINSLIIGAESLAYFSVWMIGREDKLDYTERNNNIEFGVRLESGAV